MGIPNYLKDAGLTSDKCHFCGDDECSYTVFSPRKLETKKVLICKKCLKPCPFCGGDPMCVIHPSIPGSIGDSAYIKCNDCGTYTHLYELCDFECLKNKWNTRIYNEKDEKSE